MRFQLLICNCFDLSGDMTATPMQTAAWSALLPYDIEIVSA